MPRRLGVGDSVFIQAIFRFLQIRAPFALDSLGVSRHAEIKSLLASETPEARFLIDELWGALDHLSQDDPAAPIVAARLFQFGDLGDRWSLLPFSQDFHELLLMTERCVSDLLGGATRFRIERSSFSSSEPLVELIFSGSEGLRSTVVLFSLGVFSFHGLGSLVRRHEPVRLVLPESMKPKDSLSLRSISAARSALGWNCPVHYRGHEVRIVLPPDCLEVRLRTADPGLHRIMRSRLHHLESPIEPAERGRATLQDRVIHLLRSHLSKPGYGVGDLALEFGYSIRSLERELAREGLRIRELKQRLQLVSAKSLLSLGVMPKEVAHRIGFTDAPAFSRAFRRWTGRTPSQFSLEQQK